MVKSNRSGCLSFKSSKLSCCLYVTPSSSKTALTFRSPFDAFAQIGHSVPPDVRWLMEAVYSLPQNGQFQITLRCVCADIWFTGTLFLSEYSLAISGYKVCKSFFPMATFCPEQYGHLCPLIWILMGLWYDSPHLLHTHQALYPLPYR